MPEIKKTLSSPWKSRWEKITQLRRLQYDLPCGLISNMFIQTLSDEVLMLANGHQYSERLICFIAVILQREKMVKQAKDIRKLMERRLEKWNNECFDELVEEAVRCDKSLRLNLKRENNDTKLVGTYFNRLVQRGKLREASRIINQHDKGGVLSPDDKAYDPERTVFDILSEKHPAAANPDPELLTLPCHMKEMPKLESIEITSEHVEKVARKLHGSGGPGGSTSEQWADFLLRHGKKSTSLRNAIAILTMKLNEDIVPWEKIQGLMANRLVAIDKNPGVRPIGIGEVLRRIMAKCIILASGDEIINTCGTDQLCAGLKSGIEGAIHFMKENFDERCNTEEDWCMVMVDADNAFNKINRIHALWQARIHWPRAARFIYNTYQNKAELVMAGSNKRLYSQEGVTQGDPLSMILYGLATLPLINELKKIPETNQVWYADDSSCQGKFSNVIKWWEKLEDIGPKYGYYPQITKTRIVTRSKLSKFDKNKILGMNILKGSSFLGGFIGCNEDEKNLFLQGKIEKWTQRVNNLAKVAETHPQSAHVVATKSLQAEWIFLQRVVESENDSFSPIKDAIESNLFPALFGSHLNSEEVDILHLQVKHGGIGISDPTTQANELFETSKNGCKFIINSLKSKKQMDIPKHDHHLTTTLKSKKNERKSKEEDILRTTLQNIPLRQQKIILRGANPKSKHNSWLSCIPLKSMNLDLSPMEFRDALALRYGKTPISLPIFCDGCGSDFSTEHALSCRTGGLIIKRHNEIRDTIGNLMNIAWGNCVREPLISEQRSSSLPALKADLACRGVWEVQMEALFDVRVVDTDAPSYASQTYEKVLENAEKEKKRKYLSASEARNASFTPLVTSVDGMLGEEFQSLLRAVAEKLSEKWKKPYSLVMNWVRVKTTCATLRATSMCLRRSRRKWRSVWEFEDGAGIPSFF